MGRWTQYEEDEHRLPEGFVRIGYDADEGRYYFRSRDGSTWRGAEGVEFGEMMKVSEPPSHLASQSEHHSADLEAAPAPTRPGGYRLLSSDPNQTVIPKGNVNTPAYRTLFPFFLTIAVVLLLVWRLILSPGLAPLPERCTGKDLKAHLVQPGESCWSISQKNGVEWERFKEINKSVQCEPLMPGTTVCLPASVPSTTRRTH